MRPRSEFSAQTLSVLAVLFAEPAQWQHGYALAKVTGLKSGTLYPILIRLADRGLVEACWEQEPTPGRPRRHLYRLTAAGRASATGALASAGQPGAEHPVARSAGRAGTRARGGPLEQRDRSQRACSRAAIVDLAGHEPRGRAPSAVTVSWGTAFW